MSVCVGMDGRVDVTVDRFLGKGSGTGNEQVVPGLGVYCFRLRNLSSVQQSRTPTMKLSISSLTPT
jgi:hypothetical protein